MKIPYKPIKRPRIRPESKPLSPYQLVKREPADTVITLINKNEGLEQRLAQSYERLSEMRKEMSQQASQAMTKELDYINSNLQFLKIIYKLDPTQFNALLLDPKPSVRAQAKRFLAFQQADQEDNDLEILEAMRDAYDSTSY